MGRSKQKKHAQRPSKEDAPAAFNPSANKINGIRSYNAQDLDMTGQDLFELQQDSIGLDEGMDAQDAQNEDDEVFRSAEVLPLNVKRPRDSSSDESAPEEDDSEDQQTAEPARKKSRIPKDHQPAPARPGLTSRFNKPATAEENGISASEASDPASDSDDAEEGWGNAYHVSRREVEEGPWQPRKPKKGAKRNKDEDELEMDPEQAELAEALRLQKIQRQHLDADDFGHIPVATAAAATTNIIESQSQKQELSAHQQQQQQLSFDSREAAIAHLLATSPLLLSLLNDFQDQATHARGLEAALRDISPASPLRALQTLHLQVVQSYLAVLAFWLRLALQGQQDTELGQNVFQRLVQLREGMQGLQEAGLDFDEPDSGDVYAGLPEDSEDEEDDLDSDELGSALEDDLDDERLQELMQQRDLLKMLEREGLSVKDIQAARAGDSESSDDAEHVGVESDQEPTKPVPAPEGGDKKKKKRRRRSKNNKTESQPVTSAPQPVLQLAPPESRDDFLEPSVLSTGDAADKKNKRHSLRFHAAQVASTANRRSTAAEARRQGGDADVPYVSKEQLRREAQKKAAARQEKELRARGEMPDQQDDYAEEAQAGDDGYYDLVQSSKGAAKQAKKEAYDQQRLEDRAALSAEDATVGPRAASRAILANKGLTPRRPKANRNPRVKKRENYEKAKKRVGSQKRVYDADKASKARAPGAYEGERSGINRRTVKSTKL